MLFGDELLDFFDDLHSKFNPFKANQVAKTNMLSDCLATWGYILTKKCIRKASTGN